MSVCYPHESCLYFKLSRHDINRLRTISSLTSSILFFEHSNVFSQYERGESSLSWYWEQFVQCPVNKPSHEESVEVGKLVDMIPS